MKSTVGMTLLEVLIAIVVLAVGVLAAASMQTTALRASSDARAIQDVTELAEREIELRRQFDYSDTSTDTGPKCISASEQELAVVGQDCRVEVLPCQLSGSTFACVSAGAGTDADRITVTVTGPREKTITLKTVKARP